MSHQRLPLLLQALDSAQAQTYPNLEILIVDSGSLMGKLPADRCLPNTRMIATSNEPDRRETIMGSWVQNNYIGQTRGEWITCLCDDDLLLPTYISSFADHIPGERKPTMLYSGQFRVRADRDGAIFKLCHVSLADRLRGPGEFKCQIDYLQCCVNRSMWNMLYAGYHGKPYPEEIEFKQCPDGIFMDRAGYINKALPVPGIHSFNRRTPLANYCGA